ncbi:TPA: hypothetical protein U1629_001914 [Streptococcus suis]|nr:hypothetical protein [Streptococcus suis]NQO22476.1 hypothetical protein [Streptococcus suis]NQP15731.1 hypothetical protein [Streptococcus suis]HEM5176613.1 hypothetical protein [Streptococcus suis]HEM5430798.1 hypothetical protein [Streptococcus suis]
MSLKQIRKRIALLDKEMHPSGGMMMLKICPNGEGYSVETSKGVFENFPSRVEAWKRCDQIIEEHRPDWSMVFLDEWEREEDPELDRYLEKRKLKDVRRITFIDDIPLED